MAMKRTAWHQIQKPATMHGKAHTGAIFSFRWAEKANKDATRKSPLQYVKKPTEMQRRRDPPPSSQKRPKEMQRRGKLPLRLENLKPTRNTTKGSLGRSPSVVSKSPQRCNEGEIPLRRIENAHMKHNGGEIPLRCVKKPTEMQRRGIPLRRIKNAHKKRNGEGNSLSVVSKSPQRCNEGVIPLRRVKNAHMKRNGGGNSLSDVLKSPQRCNEGEIPLRHIENNATEGETPLRVEKPTETQRRGIYPSVACVVEIVVEVVILLKWRRSAKQGECRTCWQWK